MNQDLLLAGLKTTMMMWQLLGSKILLLGMREEFLHLVPFVRLCEYLILIPKVLIFSRKKVMCFSDVSVYLHVSTQLFSSELVFSHQAYF